MREASTASGVALPGCRRPPFNPTTAVAWTIGLAFNAEQLEVGRVIGAGGGEVVKAPGPSPG